MINNQYGYSILFVEDEIALRENYVMFLKMKFETVYEAADGIEAYNIYKEKKPDILIVDINIPKLNGLDLLEKIREHDHISKAIVLTAHKDKDFLLQATSLKLTEYLVKPISRIDLERSLGKVMEELKKFKITAIKTHILSDDYIWNYNTQELSSKGTVVSLTNKERKIFILFMQNIDTVLSIDKIIYHVWNDYFEANEVTLRTLLKDLRKKLPKGTIKNVHGVGYKISS